ncbi:MAG: Short-chain dehydrogenase/reductase SDR [uncultured Aureispira sp.]|uniref:Short-chain dehydrogenase/reductase SDR n=1 Tax=uncultured Aureispira sp. TaxID=1331704 RepID=A0A6S6TCP9_9BACT|nr:MAG: Short-chain dehydrogenase/reductase SDR [uncultured Aureispira sp.]
MTQIKNRCVLITGGASGIGKLIARRCLELRAYKVILWDINEINLLKTKSEFAKLGYTVDIEVVDVASLEDIERAAKVAKDTYTTIDILFNNAGIVVGKPFAEHSHRDITKTININTSALMHIAKEFLPDMIDQCEGHIINLASASGLIANPNMSVYAASKWAVIGWSESVRLEMEREETGVHITTVMPSYISTGMFDGAKSPFMTPILTPEYIVDKIMEAVKNNEIILQEPFMVKSVPLLKGLLPQRMFDFVAGKIFGIHNTMDDFKGRPQDQAVPDKDTFSSK